MNVCIPEKSLSRFCYMSRITRELQPGVNLKGYVTYSYNVRHARRKNNFDDFVTFLKHSSATALHGLQAG